MSCCIGPVIETFNIVFKVNMFHLILGYNIKQLIAKDLCCYVFVWMQFHLTCKAWRFRKYETGSSLYMLILFIILSCYMHEYMYIYIYIHGIYRHIYVYVYW